MKSFIKIYGPPVYKALKALEKIAIDMPEVCILDASMPMDVRHGAGDLTTGDSSLDSMNGIMTFFGGAGVINEERCNNIISKSGSNLGEYDFMFEWFKTPTMDEIELLIVKIDETLEPLGCQYTITSH